MTILSEVNIVDKIPYTLYYQEGSQAKKLIYILHGINQSKEDYQDYATKLAKEGFAVVCVDAFLHGDRIDDRLTKATDDELVYLLFEIIEHTVNDLLFLTDYLKVDQRIDTTEIGVTGISMGAFMSFLLGVIDHRIKTLVPIIGLGMFKAFWDDYMNRLKTDDHKYQITEKIFEMNTAEWQSIISELDPYPLIQNYVPKPLLMINGRYDRPVPLKYNELLYEEVKPNYKDHPNHLKLSVYEVGHTVTEEMIDESIAFFKKHLA